MSSIQNNYKGQPDNNLEVAETGNASNPSPRTDSLEPMSDNQFLSAGAEKYLRESGNIEDMPDARDQQDMDETMEENGEA